MDDLQCTIFDDDYMCRIEGFEGPLDLLLTLIKDSKMDIETVHLADVTDQFVAYIKQLPEIDLTKASYYINLACTLLEIKSRALLPCEDVEIDDETDPEQLLKLRLKEYQLFKEQSMELSHIENVNHFYKLPDKSAFDYRIVLKDMSLDAMLDAFANLLVRARTEKIAETPKQIVKDKFTVAEKMISVIERIKVEKAIVFNDLFEPNYSHSELITVFLALLELLKRQSITASQEGIFSDIMIRYVENAGIENCDYTTDFDTNIEEGA